MNKFKFNFVHRTYGAYFTSVDNPDFSFYVGQDNKTLEIYDAYELQKSLLDK